MTQFLLSETLDEGAEIMAAALEYAYNLLSERQREPPSQEAVATVAHGLVTYYVHEKARRMPESDTERFRVDEALARARAEAREDA